jgi:two-component sensor histidine kinase
MQGGIGWRSVGSNMVSSSDGLDVETLSAPTDATLHLLFNTDAKLISVTGKAVAGFSANHFGRDIEETLVLTPEDTQRLHVAITTQGELHLENVLLKGLDQAYAMHFAPRYSDKEGVVGYACILQPLGQAIALPTSFVPVESAADAEPGTLFGRQLAPALRQPLGRIIANAETIGSKLQGPIRESYAVYAKDIADAARHLVALVDDLGDLEAVEQAGFSTAKDSIELGDVARRVAGLLALKAADHQITVKTPDSDHQVKATAEFRRVLQIVLNLVMNAIRYAPGGTIIRIETAQVSGFSELSVVDQGAGIKVEDREKIFAKFERLGRSGDGGSGLGLYISRRLARAMGGELSVGQGDEGGARFTLRLPE